MAFRGGEVADHADLRVAGQRQIGLHHDAANILRRLAGQPTQPFRYRDYGNLATIGRNSAVVDLTSPVGPVRFSGYFAWLFWLFAHIYFLIGFRNRIVVLMDWASAYWSFQRYARVVAGTELSSMARQPDSARRTTPP
jgi:NADH:ubiquinone reductase (H+-translocating)